MSSKRNRRRGLEGFVQREQNSPKPHILGFSRDHPVRVNHSHRKLELITLVDTPSATHDLTTTLLGGSLEVKHRLRFDSDLAIATLLFAVPGVVAALWLAPRPAIPTEMPPLVLRIDEVRASMERDEELASQSPTGEWVERAQTLYRAHNLGELRGEIREIAASRRVQLRAALAEVAREQGPEAISALRAREILRMVPALAGRGQERARAEVLGSFRSSLERWGAIVRGRRVAPDMVVRALFAARWNAVHGLPLTDGFEPIRLRAYHGWLAFHGDAAGSGLRAAALDAYERAGGMYANEARGILAFRGGAYEEAAHLFTHAFSMSGVVRMRNHAIASSAATD